MIRIPPRLGISSWTFRTRILIGFGGAIIMMVLMLSWSVISLLTLGQATASILSKNYRSILAADEMIGAVESIHQVVLLSFLSPDEKRNAEILSNESRFLQWLARAKDNITELGEPKILSAIETDYTLYLAEIVPMLDAALPNSEITTSYLQKGSKIFQTIRNNCLQLREINETAQSDSSVHAQNLAKSTISVSLAAGLTAIGLVLAFSLVISRRLARPVEQLREAVLRLAQGDYDVRVNVRGSDELALLSNQFNRMALRLKQFHDLNIGRILAEKQKNEAILQSVDDGIVVIDTDNKIVNMNPMAERIFRTSASECLDRHVLEIIREDRLFGLIKQALTTGRPPEMEADQNLLNVPNKEGAAHYQFSIAPIKVRNRDLLGVVLLLRDVTRLRELDRLKSEFVMTASHELRTPLTSMGMSVALLKEKAAFKLDEKELDLLNMADEEIGRLKALVNELLDLSKIEAGQIALEYETIAVELLCEKAESLMSPQAEAADVHLESIVDRNLPRVRADPNKITWVLVNLIGNAIRHTPASGRVIVGARAVGDQVHVWVEDSGEGIPEKELSRIFDKFVQVKSVRTGGGAGLGLAICKEIIRAHGGVIWAESQLGRGSTFTFTLPVFK